MASRKDKKGRVFRKGESYSDSKGMYLYAYTDTFGTRRYIYAKDLPAFWEKEEQLKKNQLDTSFLFFCESMLPDNEDSKAARCIWNYI